MCGLVAAAVAKEEEQAVAATWMERTRWRTLLWPPPIGVIFIIPRVNSSQFDRDREMVVAAATRERGRQAGKS